MHFLKKEIRILIIRNIKKESLDIEIDGKLYQLTGQLAQDGFHASQTEISYVSDEEHPIPMEERQKLAKSIAENPYSGSQEFVDFLLDTNVKLTTHLCPISDIEKNKVLQIIQSQWTESNAEFALQFDMP